MPKLPTGTVTFLFTDIEGSTNLARTLGDRWPDVLEEHHEILRAAIRGAGGVDIRTEGDAFFAVFTSAVDAVAACAEAQRGLSAHAWPEDGSVRVRMGLHTGEGRLSRGEYIGLDLHRAARIAAAGHGGQVLVSETTRSLAGAELPEGVTLRDLGPHRLKDFDEPQHVHQLVIGDLPSDFPAIRSLEIPTNLPVRLTTFVGREREVAHVVRLLDAARLVTLTGPGGTGKTRLALRVGSEVLDHFRDGVFFVDLSPITDPALVASAIGRTLGVRDDGGRPIQDAVADHLRDRELLLILDNFEQVAEAWVVVEAILSGAPQVRAVVTSRMALRLYGEQEFAVPPLTVPDRAATGDVAALSQNESVALFVERARAVRHDFALTDENAAAVAEICRRLDGLPLAIELAASRIKVLGPEAILARLEHRLPLLTSGSRNLPARQRTLRGAIEWSYELLDDPERRLLARLSVFMGGHTVEAAEAVANPDAGSGVDTLDALSSLVDKSLIRQGDDGGESRFQMLETIREFAGERLDDLGEANDRARRHAAYFLALAEEAEPHLVAEDQGLWLDRCEREHDNLRAALTWALEGGATEVGLRMAGALWRFWQQRGYLREGRAWIRRLLSLPGLEETVALARAHTAGGGLAYWDVDVGAMREHYEEALRLYERLGDRRGVAWATYDLSFVPLREGDLATWEKLARESLALGREIADPEVVLQATVGLGFGKLQRQDPDAAIPLIREAIDQARSMGNAHQLVQALSGLGGAHRMRGEFDRASESLREALRIVRDAGNVPMSGYLLLALAGVEAERGGHQRAIRLYGAADQFREKFATMPTTWEELVPDDLLARARSAIGDEATDVGLAEGRALDPNDAVAYALGETS